MNHNPYNFIPGDIVTLDKDKSNSSTVRIVRMTPNKIFSRVHFSELKEPKDENCWSAMTNRLTPIIKHTTFKSSNFCESCGGRNCIC